MRNLPINKIIAKAKHHIFSSQSGLNTSKQYGDGYDFAQIRAYENGDNSKRIDWKQSAKTQKLQTKVFYEDKEAFIHIIACMNGSLHFGIEKKKQELLSEIIALIGLNAVSCSNIFSLSCFSDRLLFKLHQNKKESYILNAVNQSLQMNVLGEKIDYKKLQTYAMYEIKQASVLFLLGDFLDLPTLKLFNQKHEVVVIIIRDAFEENPLNIGDLRVKDPETYEEVDVSFDNRFIKSYKSKQKKHDYELNKYLTHNNIPCVKVYTNEDPYYKILNFLRKY